MPVETDPRFKCLAFLERGCTNDVLIFPKTAGLPSLSDVLATSASTDVGTALSHLSKSAMVGTVSGRRQSFLLSRRPDVIPIAVRGQIETRLKRLHEGRVDAIVLAEVGLRRLNSINALAPWMLQFSALRLDDHEWPTAPGQGAISVHVLSENTTHDLEALRSILNHEKTERDVSTERDLLRQIGGGCLYPAGIKIDEEHVSIKISPINWREIFCQGRPFTTMTYQGNLSDLNLVVPSTPAASASGSFNGPKLISTLNSDRLSNILSNKGIHVLNKPVLDLLPKTENWPQSFIDAHLPRSKWPYLVLTSPFAAKCAIQVAKENGDINRIQWLAIGEGTARACFKQGVTVSICAKARNSLALADYIEANIDPKMKLMLPRSDVAPDTLLHRLKNFGFEVQSWVGYHNQSKTVEPFSIEPNDVLLLSSPSSVRSWVENSLNIPKNILCMGQTSLDEIKSMSCFDGSTVEVLEGPTAEFLSTWWNEWRSDES